MIYGILVKAYADNKTCKLEDLILETVCHLDNQYAYLPVVTVALISGLGAIVLLLLIAIVAGFICCSR